MIKAVNILLFLLCLVLGFFLVKGIMDPIKAKNQVESRNKAVHTKLLKIRNSQEAFRNVHEKFAPNFDTLKLVLKNDSFETINRTNGESKFVSILDSLFGGDVSLINNLDKVPNSNSKFNMDAGFLQSPNDSTLYVPVFEASTYTDDYMGEVSKDFWKTKKKVKVGSMTAPITSGNWQ